MRVFISPKYSPLRRGEECLRGGVDTFAVAYPKVGKGLHSGVGCYATADQKVRPHKFMPDTQRRRDLRCCVPECVDMGFFILKHEFVTL